MSLLADEAQHRVAQVQDLCGTSLYQRDGDKAGCHLYGLYAGKNEEQL